MIDVNQKREEYMLGELKDDYPHIHSKIIETMVINAHEIIIWLNDERIFSYYVHDSELIELPPNSKNMNHEEYAYLFGINLRRIMNRKGLMQEDLTEMTGIPQSMISRYFTGKACPSANMVRKIAMALGCSMDDFTYWY